MATALDSAETHFIEECDMERTRRPRRRKGAREPDPQLVTAAANLLSVMTGIPGQPMELKQKNAQGALWHARTIGDADALAFILRVIFEAYGVSEEAWVRAVND